MLKPSVHFFLEQGEHKSYFPNGNIANHCFYVNDYLHGEYKAWHTDGHLAIHCFFVHDKRVSFDEIPYPKTEEDRLYFNLKYDLQLIPAETKC